MMIPAGKAGLVIGKGGETIKQLQVNCILETVTTLKHTPVFNHDNAQSREIQERAGVKMILIQDVSQGPNVDKPLRIIGDPYKVQVHLYNLLINVNINLLCPVAM